jgi:hypothetical protein
MAGDLQISERMLRLQKPLSDCDLIKSHINENENPYLISLSKKDNFMPRLVKRTYGGISLTEKEYK